MPRRHDPGRFVLVLLVAAGCGREPSFEVLPPGSLRTHYLIDLEHRNDSTALRATMSHLVVFNPGPRPARLDAAAYYEDREPDRFTLEAAPNTSTETNSGKWPIRAGARFALALQSSEPVVAQATIGWTNTNGNYRLGARTLSPRGPRETAKSYQSITGLARRWYYADGIVIQPSGPPTDWIRESEWAVLLNPGDDTAHVTLRLHYKDRTVPHTVTVAPRRVLRVFMDELAVWRRHYGVSVESDREVAAQWIRLVNWTDSDEPMAEWSLPFLPLREAAPPP